MTEKPKRDIASDADIFARSDIYPDAAALLAFRQASITEMKKDCIVVLDANVLLQPYEVDSKEAVNEIERVYRELAAGNRLVIPAQSVREYQAIRPRKLATIAAKIQGAIDSLNKVRLDRIPFLENEYSFKVVRESVKQTRAHLDPAIQSLQSEIAKLRADEGSDRIAILYREVLARCVVDVPLNSDDRRKLVTECQRSTRLDIAPGFADADKDDLGIGDLLIWQTLLEEAHRRKVHCLFVTLETKSDWWIRQKGAFLPRPELVEEYRGRTSGRTVRLITLSELLEIFAAPLEVVSEVKHSEEVFEEAEIANTQKRVFQESLAKPVFFLEEEISQLIVTKTQLDGLLGRMRNMRDTIPDETIR